MRRDKIYKLVKCAVILSFLYLFFFENELNINEILLKIFKCESQQITYFKVVIVSIIFTIYWLIIKYIENNDSELFSNGLIYYAKKYPVRTLCGTIIAVFTVFVAITILTNYKKYILIALLLISYIIIGTAGYSLGRKREK